MANFNPSRSICVAMLLLIGFALLTTTAAAQSVKVQGLIKTRNGDTMTLQTPESPKLVVLLTDNTQVG